MIKNIIRLLAFSFLFLPFLLVPSFATEVDTLQDDVFVPGFEDIPLMQGLTEAGESVASFDSPSGRFIQVYMVADKTLKKTKILSFYKEALIPLGWEKTKTPYCFKREDEVLCLDISGEVGNLIVKFELNSVAK